MSAQGPDAPPAMTTVSEVVLKKRKINERWAEQRKLQLQERVKRHKFDMFIKKPDQFIREYRDKELDLVRMKSRVKRSRKSSAKPLDSKLLFVIRIGGKNDMHPSTRKVLYSLRLRNVNTGVFVKANAAVMEMLQKVEPYVTYGYPNVKSVKDLIYKKAIVKLKKRNIPLADLPMCEQDLIKEKATAKLGKVKNPLTDNNILEQQDMVYKNLKFHKIPLTDNNLVEQILGEHGIICIEDIVNEIANVGPHFKDVTGFLCPFKLNKAEKALFGKKKRFTDGGDSGNRADLINELISKMN